MTETLGAADHSGDRCSLSRNRSSAGTDSSCPRRRSGQPREGKTTGSGDDMCLRGLLHDIPVWLVPGQDAGVGRWLQLGLFPRGRTERVRGELAAIDEAETVIR